MDEETASAAGPEWLEDYENGLRDIPDIQRAEADFYRTPMADHTHPFDNPVSDRMMYGLSLEELKASLMNVSLSKRRSVQFSQVTEVYVSLYFFVPC